MAEQFERLERKLVHHGNIIDFFEDGRILMVKQFRNALDRETLEIPAGGRNDVEEPFIQCSYRELEEETGYRCEKEDMEFLISIRTTVAFCNERIEVYVARNLKRSHQHLDEDEFINVYPYTTDELSRLIYEGKIQDAKTIASLMAYINKYVKN